MPVIHDLAYYGGNANNKRYHEYLAAQNAPVAPATADVSATIQGEIAIAETLLNALKADSATLTPPAPDNVPTWKAKA